MVEQSTWAKTSGLCVGVTCWVFGHLCSMQMLMSKHRLRTDSEREWDDADKCVLVLTGVATSDSKGPGACV